MDQLNQKTFAEIYSLNIDDYKEIPLSDYEFSVRTSRRLGYCGVASVADLLAYSPYSLMLTPGFGNKCLEEITSFIQELSSNTISTPSATSKLDYKGISIISSNIDAVLSGDFSFTSAIELNETQLSTVAAYQKAYNALGNELVNLCYSNPQKIEPYFMMFSEYIELSNRRSALRELQTHIPHKRLQNRAFGYIRAFTTNEAIRSSLNGFCTSDQTTLIDLINEAPISNEHDYTLLQKFLKWCSFDLLSEIEELLGSIYSQERVRNIIKMRAEKKTLEYIGNTMDITRERVRQIEAKAKSRFAFKHKNIRIISKIAAERNGDTVLTREEVEGFCGKYTEELMYFLQNYQGINFTYDKQLDVFIVGDDSLHSRVDSYIDSLPEIFNINKLPEIIKNGYEEADLPEDILGKAIDDAYKLTGEVYHRSRLSLAAVYSSIIEKYYPNGLQVYDPYVLDEFRSRVIADYGEVEMPAHNRALSARIAGICILCGKGKYRLKKKNYISSSLAQRIHDYIVDSSHGIFLTNTLFAEFEDDLVSEGIDNKYYLQGVLHELFEDEFFFRRDYVSKDPSLTSMYSSIINYIKNSDYPVSKEQLRLEFPGVTEIIFLLSVEDPEILNYFGEYLHASKLIISDAEKIYLKSLLEKFVADGKIIHCKDIFEVIDRERPEILTRNASRFAFSAFSILEYLFRNDYQFSRPYIAQNGVEIGRAAERLHDLIYSNEIFDLSCVKDFSSETHYIVYSLLDLANSCNDEFLLIDTSTLVRIDKTGITEEIAKNIEQIILEEVTGTMPIAELTIWNKLPAINVSWSDWLIYSIINKWATALEVSTSSNQLRQSIPLISLKGCMDSTLYKDVNKSDFEGIIKIDDLDNIDELIEDYIGDEIWEDEL